MKEKKIEQHLTQAMRRVGGFSFKWTCPNVRGVPDRICQFPSGQVVFVELKTTGQKVRPEQKRMLDFMSNRGSKVFVLDTLTAVDELIKHYTQG